MSVEEKFSEISERYKSYSTYDNIYGVVFLPTILCFLFWVGSLGVYGLNIETGILTFTLISLFATTYIVYVIKQSYALKYNERLFLHTYSCYTNLDRYLGKGNNNDRKKAIENLEELIGILKTHTPIYLLSIPSIHRDLEERLLPIIKNDDKKNMNQALSVLKEFIPFAQGDINILYSAEKSQSFKSELYKLPAHKKQWTIPVLLSKTKSIDGVMFISIFLVPTSIFLAGVHIFKYTEKEMYLPTVAAFVSLMASFVIRKRK